MINDLISGYMNLRLLASLLGSFVEFHFFEFHFKFTFLAQSVNATVVFLSGSNLFVRLAEQLYNHPQTANGTQCSTNTICSLACCL